MMLVLLATGVIGLLCMATELFRVRARWMRWQRRADPPGTCEHHCTARGLDPTVAGATVTHLQRWMRQLGVANFPVRPTDHLLDVYGLYGEGLEEVLSEIARAAGCGPLREPTFGPFVRMQTVGNVVQLLSGRRAEHERRRTRDDIISQAVAAPPALADLPHRRLAPLPSQQPATGPRDLDRPAAHLAGGPAANVLVVEDDSNMRELLTHILQRAGYAVIPAQSGAKALAVARAHRVDALVLDFNVPDMRGDEILQHATVLQPHLRQHAMFITGDGTARTDDLIRGCGAPCLHKPFAARELMDTVRTLMPPDAAPFR